MDRYRGSVRLIIALLGIALSASLASAQILVGVPGDRMGMVYAEQQKNQWCWAASLQMVFNYYGADISQQAIVQRSYGSLVNGDLPNRPGGYDVITQNLNQWGLDSRGKRFVVAATVNYGCPPAYVLVQELSQGHPVILSYKSSDTTAHAVVCTAVNYRQGVNGPEVMSIIVRDPWGSPENKAVQGRLEWPGWKLASLIQGYWIIRMNAEQTPATTANYGVARQPNGARAVACQHRIPCTHQVPCVHYAPCQHWTACVHAAHAYDTYHPYDIGPQGLAQGCVHTMPCAHRLHTADPLHMYDLQHPYDVQHMYDLQHAYDLIQ